MVVTMHTAMPDNQLVITKFCNFCLVLLIFCYVSASIILCFTHFSFVLFLEEGEVEGDIIPVLQPLPSSQVHSMCLEYWLFFRDSFKMVDKTQFSFDNNLWTFPDFCPPHFIYKRGAALGFQAGSHEKWHKCRVQWRCAVLQWSCSFAEGTLFSFVLCLENLRHTTVKPCFPDTYGKWRDKPSRSTTKIAVWLV